MGKKEKRPTFDEVYKTLSKNSAKMNSRMPLNSSLTNEQMFRCYVQNTVPKLQKSNDTFGETELNTVLMKLLGNDPSGNALTPTPLATAPTAALTPLTAAPSAAPTAALTGALTAALTGAPTAALTGVLPPPPPPPALSTASLTAPTAALTAALTAAPTAPTTGLTPLAIPPLGLAPPPAPSPILAAASSLGGTLGNALLNMASTFYSPAPAIAGLPTTAPVSPATVLPATNLGAAFTSVATPTPDPIKLAREFAATQALMAFNVPGLQQVINTRGAPLRAVTPLEKEISAGNQLLNKISQRKIDTADLTGDLKINYDRALELKRQVAQKLATEKGAKQVKKAATLATKKEKDARRESTLSITTTVAGSPNPETKAQKQSRIKADKEAAKAAAPPSTETPFERKIRRMADKTQKTLEKIIKSAPIGAAKTAAKEKAKKDAKALALAAAGGNI